MPTYLLAFIVSDFDYITNEGDVGEGERIHRFVRSKSTLDSICGSSLIN